MTLRHPVRHILTRIRRDSFTYASPTHGQDAMQRHSTLHYIAWLLTFVSCAWHDWFTRMTCLFHDCCSVTWLVQTCDSEVLDCRRKAYDSFKCVTWNICPIDTTLLFAWHDLFTHVHARTHWLTHLSAWARAQDARRRHVSAVGHLDIFQLTLTIRSSATTVIWHDRGGYIVCLKI